ncbi:MAG: hypothetical protein R3D67_06035 [Hyphomicrobiaceae bacterium]
MRETAPTYIDPAAWQQAIGLSRQICARIFRDGGTPSQALEAVGLPARAELNWDKAVELVAEAMSHTQIRRAA